jgi:hypothetical protein
MPVDPLSRYSGFNKKQRNVLDSAFDVLETEGGGSPEPSNFWTPLNMSTPVDALFDPSTDSTLSLVAGSRLVNTVSPMSGAMGGTATNLICNQADPAFGLQTSLWFPGASGSKLAVTGAGNIGRNKSAITLFLMGRFLTETFTAANTGTALIYVGTPTPDASRASLARSNTVANGLRLPARRLDADTPASADVGGNLGSCPWFAWVEYDYANAVRRLYINDVLIDTAAILTAGNTSDTASEAVNFGMASTTSLATFSMHLGGIHGGIISTADRNRMFGWALHRAGLAELLPSDHPYKASAPTT